MPFSRGFKRSFKERAGALGSQRWEQVETPWKQDPKHANNLYNSLSVEHQKKTTHLLEPVDRKAKKICLVAALATQVVYNKKRLKTNLFAAPVTCSKEPIPLEFHWNF